MSDPDRPRHFLAGNWRRALVLALLALACAILLGGLSAWFLAAVSIAGVSAATALVFNFHIPGALVRLFAIGRTAARYGERLFGHDAALSDQVSRRTRLFSTMARAPGVREAGWQLADDARLTDYLDDVEDLDFGRLRVTLPAATLVGAGAVLTVATLLLAPLAVLGIGGSVLLALWAALSIRDQGRTALAEARRARSNAASHLGALAEAIVPLRAEKQWEGSLDHALTLWNDGSRLLARIGQKLAVLEAVSALIVPFAAVSIIGAGWWTGARGPSLLPLVFLAFAWLAFAETVQLVPRMLLAGLKRGLARETLVPWQGAGNDDITPTCPARVLSVTHRGIERCAPDCRPLGWMPETVFLAGAPTVLAGPSGVGKTSLLKQLAGWIGDDQMMVDGANVGSLLRRHMVLLCLHDAAVMDDSVRANLFAPDARDEDLEAALRLVDLDDRVVRAGGLDGWIGQDMLSRGEAQRLNLARALVSPCPIILFDEPTEHLDPAQGDAILARLLERLSDRVVVLSSHRPVTFEGVRVISLE